MSSLLVGLALARYTGRRLGSIVRLKAPDVLLAADQCAQAIARSGREEYLAENTRTRKR